MAAMFLDTSALARRYFVREPGFDRIKAILSGSGTVLASQLATVEFASALARRVREGTIGEDDRGRLWRAFQSRVRSGVRLMQIDRAVMASAERLHLEHSIRALDSIQVSSATIAAGLAAEAGERLVFVTADQRQAAVASAAGLTVEVLS